MTELQWTVEGRRFRNEDEYKAAMRDKTLIDSITHNRKLDDPKDVEAIYKELQTGKYQFESIVGRRFDDNIYELYEQNKRAETEKLEQQRAKKEKRRQHHALKAKKADKSVKENNNEKISLEDFDKDMQSKILQVIRQKERKRKFVLAACVFVCVLCFGYLGAYYQVSAKSSQDFEDLAELKERDLLTPTSRSAVRIHYTGDAETPDILPEYETLYNKNKRLIGWIKIDDTVVDYPVMQTVDNEYYLDHNYDHKKDNNGCIFMDYQCDVINGSDNYILYGHHMKSGKMFGSLNKYSQQSYYEAHPKIHFDTIYEKGEYQIMYVFRSRVYSEEDVNFKYYQFINAGSQEEFDSYLNEMAQMSLYDTGVTANYGDQLLTLSTCDYQENDGRFVVVAKRVS